MTGEQIALRRWRGIALLALGVAILATCFSVLIWAAGHLAFPLSRDFANTLLTGFIVGLAMSVEGIGLKLIDRKHTTRADVEALEAMRNMAHWPEIRALLVAIEPLNRDITQYEAAFANRLVQASISGEYKREGERARAQRTQAQLFEMARQKT